jgi:hypothetical protein
MLNFLIRYTDNFLNIFKELNCSRCNIKWTCSNSYKGKILALLSIMRLRLLVEQQLRSFLTFGTRWRWMISATLQPMYCRGKSTFYPLDGMGPGWMLWRREKSSSSPRIEARLCVFPVRSLVIILTEISDFLIILPVVLWVWNLVSDIKGGT